MLRRGSLGIFLACIVGLLSIVLFAAIQQPHSQQFNLEDTVMRLLKPFSTLPLRSNTTTSRRAFASFISRPAAIEVPSTSKSMASDQQSNLASNEGKHPLFLPAPPVDGETMQMDMSSGQGTINMAHLGPMVVNKDGTISSISNWDQMTEAEQANTLKVLGKRNKARREALQAKEEAGAEKGA